MNMYAEADQIQEIISAAEKIVIIQADNPDADSLGSALAMEHILGDMGKEVSLYCAVDIPGYLRYMPGWDRVGKELPNQFDTSVIVDASTMTLFERLNESSRKGWLASKPCVVLDHHQVVENVITFATVMINDGSRSSAGELIYVVAKQLGWPLSVAAEELIVFSILGDTQGLSNQLASAETHRIIADMIEAGVDRPKLEEQRRELGKMPPEILKYKAVLINHTEFESQGSVATVTVPQVEINQYSPLYNPGPLILNDVLQTKGVRVGIVFKRYDDGKVTATIRCNPGAGIAAELADRFGGGGHAFASGFKVTSGKSFEEIKAEAISLAAELLSKQSTGNNETS